MHIRKKFKKFSSAIKHVASKSPNINAAPTVTAVNAQSPITSTAYPPSTKTRFGDWPQFYALRKTLEERQTDGDWLIQTRWVGNFMKYLDIFDNKLIERHEYGAMLDELATLCEEMKQFYGRDVLPEMTNATRGLYLIIEHELFCLKYRWDNASSQTHDIGEYDIDFVIACYRRIQNCLRRILFNMMARENDDTVDTIDMLHLLEHASVIRPQAPQHKIGYDNTFELRSCATGTRVNVLDWINAWINNPSSGSVYWVNGMAGTGKTAIASSLCKQLNEHHKLAASHFCSRSPWCQDSRVIIPSIAYQIAEFSWPFRSALSKILGLTDPGWHHNSHSPDLLFMYLIVRPLLEIKHTLPDCVVVVIDAIDECMDKEFLHQVLGVLIARAPSLPVKFVICSRPEPQVRDLISNQNNQGISRIILHELDRHEVKADIEAYFRSSLLLGAVWPVTNFHSTTVAEVIPALARQSGHLFVWAAILHQEISARGNHVRGIPLREAALFPYTETLRLSNEAYYKDIKIMYARILQAALGEANPNEAEMDDIRRVIYLVACTKEPLGIHEISRILKWPNTKRVQAALRPLWSVLHVSENKWTVEVLHPSFPEYILDPFHSEQYCCDPRVYSNFMAPRCFQYFQTTQTSFNICGLKSSYTSDSKVAGLEEQAQVLIPINLFYAAQHWIVHLRFASMSHGLLHRLEKFLSLRLLLWMEVMTLRGCAQEVPEAIRLANAWAEDSACSQSLRLLMHDAWRFTKVFTLGMVSTSTPHIYTSMLPLWPNRRPIAKCYAGNMQEVIRAEGTALDWQQGALLATWRFAGVIKSPVISPDGTKIAVGVGYNILILNASTGQLTLPPFKGHSDMVLTVQFSADGTRVVSSSLDHTIRVWSLQNGATAIGPIKSHTGIVNCVAFSPDGLRIVSGSQDGTLFIWDSLTETPLIGPLTEHAAIREVKYAPHGRWVAACTRNGIVILNAEDGRTLQVFLAKNDHAPYCSMDISPDCTRIASATIENSIYVWDAESGQMLLGPLSPVKIAYDHEPFVSISFSPDGSRLASSSPDGSLRIWDIHSGTLLDSPMKGHTDCITSVGFSPDGTYVISGSHDNTLRLWSVQNISPKLEQLPGPANSITSVGFSYDGTQVVSSSIDGNVCTWDSRNGDMLSFFEIGHTGRALNAHSAVKGHVLSNSPVGLILLGSRMAHIAVGPIQLDQPIQSAIFSSDGTRIILASTRNTVRVLAADTGDTRLEFCAPITSQSRWAHITSIASSPDGSRIAIGSMHYSFSIHDVHSGQLLYGPFDGYTNKSSALAFSPDGTRIASGSFSTVQVQDLQSGEIVLGPLEGHMGWVTSVDYSPDGAFIVSGARDSSICVWDAQTGESVIGPVKWHTGAVNSVKFSPDSARIVSGSDDKTIRVTNVKRDLDFLSDSLTPTGTDWELSEDGWIRDKGERLLAWVPPELRTVLMWPRTELLISTRGWLRLSFANARIGESWAGCYKPPQDVPELEIDTRPERNDSDGESDKGENDTNDEPKGDGEGSPAELSEL